MGVLNNARLLNARPRTLCVLREILKCAPHVGDAEAEAASAWRLSVIVYGEASS